MTKIFILTSFFMRFKFAFCYKGMKTIQTIKDHHYFLMLFPLIMLKISLRQDNAIFLHLESSKN